MYREIIARLNTTRGAFEKGTNGERAIQEAITYIEQAQNTIESLQRYIQQCESGEAYWVKCLIDKPKETAKEILDELARRLEYLRLDDLYKKYDIIKQ